MVVVPVSEDYRLLARIVIAVRPLIGVLIGVELHYLFDCPAVREISLALASFDAQLCQR